MQKTLTAFAIIIIFFGFTEAVNPPPSNWYQQFMPNLNNKPLLDITFTDSLTGFAITTNGFSVDTNYILKTSNGGNNWNIVNSVYASLTRVQFINSGTGFISGGTAAGDYLIKSTNGGLNWSAINVPASAKINDMFVLNSDTIWIMDDEISYNVQRTTNGGINWLLEQSYTGPTPTKIYMYNKDIGFIAETGTSGRLWRTTNGGFNWTLIAGESGFIQMYFVDSLTGWKTNANFIKFTSDGGLNWSVQNMPSGGNIAGHSIVRFQVISRDTLWGAGGYLLYPNNQYRGILYRTTNGGNNWLFQIPDTTINIASYEFINFINFRIGWAYSNYPTFVTGIHTTTGGDTNWILGIQKISNIIPKDFKLYQNFPNPFNPVTIIKYDVKPQTAHVKLRVYDLEGREVLILVNQRQGSGTYSVDFSGHYFSSGVYFYQLIIDGIVIDTKKMVLLK